MMDIPSAGVTQLKSYIQSLMQRCEAIASHFGLVPTENFRTEPLAEYVRDVADIVDLSRQAQNALARLIEADGRRVEQFCTEKSLGDCYFFAEFNIDDLEQLRINFLCTMHQLSGHSNCVATHFSKDVGTGLILSESKDYSEQYAKYRTEIAEIYEMSLQAQIALSQILRADNRDRFRAGL